MATRLTARRERRVSPTSESRLVQVLLIGLALLFMAVVLVLPPSSNSRARPSSSP